VSTAITGRIRAAIGSGVVSGLAAFYFYLRVRDLTSVTPPSSTEALVYLFGPLYALLFVLLGAGAGLALSVGLERVSPEWGRTVRPLVAIVIVMAGDASLVSAMAAKARSDQARLNSENTLGVKVDTGAIRRVLLGASVVNGVDLSKKDAVELTLAQINAHEKRPFRWSGRDVDVHVDGSVIVVRNATGHEIVRRDLDWYSWVAGVWCLTVDFDSTTSFLFVLSDLRPTSQTALLSVFAEDGRLVYEELFNHANILVTSEMVGGGTVVALGRSQGWYSGTRMTMHDWGYTVATARAP
jgi:hypothetical protein